MLLNGKLIDDVIESDLQTLIDNQVFEKKTIEYKRELKCNKDSDKKEFIHDVSSFANASGGHLIFGVKEDQGVPIEISGLEINDVDKEKLRLEDIIRNGIAPRIPVYTIHPIALRNGKYVIIIDIPRSFALPHMVTFQNSSRFYSRNSAGKYQLDINELRTAFTVSQTLVDQIRDFRRERLSMIISDETPVVLIKDAKLVLHLVPLNAFGVNPLINATEIEKLYYQNNQIFRPLSGGGYQQKYNLDGFLTYTYCGERNEDSFSYLQVFRNGIIEVNTSLFTAISDKTKKPFIDKEYEFHILQNLPNYLKIQKIFSITTPIFIFLSMIKVKDYIIGYNAGLGRSSGYPIDRDNLILPEIMIEDYNVDLSTVMKPIFDAVWNAAGYPQSMNYDQAGNWKASQR